MWCSIKELMSRDCQRRWPSSLLFVLTPPLISQTFTWLVNDFAEVYTLSACLRQSILRIFPFWSGFDRTHMAGFLPVMESTKSSRHSWAMSFRNFPRRREAHFCFTSTFSACKENNMFMKAEKAVSVSMPALSGCQSLKALMREKQHLLGIFPDFTFNAIFADFYRHENWVNYA